MVRFARLFKAMTAAAGAGIFCTTIPQTLGLDKYRSTLSNYTYGEMTPIDPNTQLLIEQVMKTMNLNEKKITNLSYFVAFDNNPVSKGSSVMRTGAIVGLPPTIKYQTEADIAQEELTVGPDQTHVDWDKDSGRSLMKALVLSDKAKRFMIAREINFTTTYHVLVDLFTKLSFFSMGYAGFYYTNVLMGMNRAIPLPIGLAVFGLVGIFLSITYLLVIDTYVCWRDVRIDRKTAAISTEMAEGGLEYYQKTLERNVAIRDQLGAKAGPKVYTVYGNEVGTWRTRHAPLTSRRDLMQTLVPQTQDKLAS